MQKSSLYESLTKMQFKEYYDIKFCIGKYTTCIKTSVNVMRKRVTNN